MECPTCNHLNSAMAVHCTQCGATLIHEAVGHSAAYQEGMRTLDTRMHVGLGAFAGFFLIAFLLKFVFTAHGWSDRDLWSAALVGAAGGAFLGRLLLKAKLAS